MHSSSCTHRGRSHSQFHWACKEMPGLYYRTINVHMVTKMPSWLGVTPSKYWIMIWVLTERSGLTFWYTKRQDYVDEMQTTWSNMVFLFMWPVFNVLLVFRSASSMNLSLLFSFTYSSVKPSKDERWVVVCQAPSAQISDPNLNQLCSGKSLGGCDGRQVNLFL